MIQEERENILMPVKNRFFADDEGPGQFPPPTSPQGNTPAQPHVLNSLA